jgi:hypothetical protein
VERIRRKSAKSDAPGQKKLLGRSNQLLRGVAVRVLDRRRHLINETVSASAPENPGIEDHAGGTSGTRSTPLSRGDEWKPEEKRTQDVLMKWIESW